MFTAIKNKDMYESRIKKDVTFMLVALFSEGSILKAEDIMQLDNINAHDSEETTRQAMGAVIDELKERQVDFNKEKERKEAETQEQNDNASQAPLQRMQVLF